MAQTDLVVVLPGILGSTLGKDGKLVWAPSAGSVLRAIRTFGDSIGRLQLPDGIGDDRPYDGVEPVSLMPDVHVLPGIWTPLKGYDSLVARLRSLGYSQPGRQSDSSPVGLLPIAYDWRLSCRYNGERLRTIIEPALEQLRGHGGPYADAQVVFVCHSMGGLIARWYIEKCGGAEITRKLITLGTPYRGAARALGQLTNGADKRLGPLHLPLTSFARSMPSLYQLLPEYACIERPEGLAKTTDVDLPELDAAMVRDAMAFHESLQEAETQRPESLEATHAIVGIGQETATTARLANGRVELVTTYLSRDLAGDATVPIVSACRADVPMDSNMLRRIPDKHGNLQRNAAALDEVEGILTAESIIVKAAERTGLRVDAPEFSVAGDDIEVEITPTDDTRHAIRLAVISETGALIEARVLRPTNGPMVASIDGLAPGAYMIEVDGVGPISPFAPVSSDILVWA